MAFSISACHGSGSLRAAQVSPSLPGQNRWLCTSHKTVLIDSREKPSTAGYSKMAAPCSLFLSPFGSECALILTIALRSLISQNSERLPHNSRKSKIGSVNVQVPLKTWTFAVRESKFKWIAFGMIFAVVLIQNFLCDNVSIIGPGTSCDDVIIIITQFCIMQIV